MRLATLDGRVGIVTVDGFDDIAKASGGQFGPEPLSVLDQWDEFVGWASSARAAEPVPADEKSFGAPIPLPRQVFALAANYGAHALEAGVERMEKPYVFSKFSSCVTGGFDDVLLPSNRADWEVELVVVIGRRADRVSKADAAGYIAGYTVGQDISERRVQFNKGALNLVMGKSFPTFGPIGPVLVTLDEFATPDDLGISCSINGDEQQSSRTSDMLFSVTELVEFISAQVTLLPGDLIFTGTPAGVGSSQDPRRYLEPGDVITSTVEGVGTIVNTCKAI